VVKIKIHMSLNTSINQFLETSITVGSPSQTEGNKIIGDPVSRKNANFFRLIVSVNEAVTLLIF